MNLAERVIELAIQIQQIPAPTFEEGKRAEFVRVMFEREGLEEVEIDAVGNVYGKWNPSATLRARVDSDARVGTKPLIISAHLDTVFPFDTDLSVRREGDKVFGPGIGDNSLGVAALFGLLWELTSPPTPLPKGEGSRDVWLVANVCEEGLGDLRGMKAVVERFGSEVQAYLVLEGMALGNIYHRGTGVKRYRVTAKTAGGHSWSDYGKPSAIHELSKLIVELTSLELPSEPRTTMNVGKISGGTSINVIASEASFELDLRSEGQESLAELISQVEIIVQDANKPDVKFDAEVIGSRSAGEISADHPLIKLAQECVRVQGLEPTLTSGSTDANIPLSRGYPAFVLGISTGGGAHTTNEFINTGLVEKGLGQLVRFVRKLIGLQ